MRALFGYSSSFDRSSFRVAMGFCGWCEATNRVSSVPCTFGGCTSVVFVSSMVPTGRVRGKRNMDEAAFGPVVTVVLEGPVLSWCDDMF